MWSRRIRAALFCVGFAACLPAFDPDLDASTLGDTEIALCGAHGGPCCEAPAPACEDELSCDPDEHLCMRQPVLLCDSDVECAEGEVCCQSGLIGRCERGGSDACPGLDLGVETPRFDYDPVDLRFFDPAVDSDRCLIERGCVGGEGWRRLLGISTVVNNVGEADLLLGSPDDTSASTVATCGGEQRFAKFLRYELLDSTGTKAQQDVAATCSPASSGPFIAPFDCDFQGIWSGFSQAYWSSLNEGSAADDCGWLDITGLLPGTYTLRVTVNPESELLEENFDNNAPAELTLEVPSFDPSAPCPTPPNALQGDARERECGWVRHELAGGSACAPGELVSLTCTSADPDYLCGDFRVCDGPAVCSFEGSLADTESSCFNFISPQLDLDCPPSGELSVWIPGDAASDFHCERIVYDDVGSVPDAGVPGEP